MGEHVGSVSSSFALEIPLLMEDLVMARAWLWSELVSPWHCTALTPFCKIFLLMVAALFAKIILELILETCSWVKRNQNLKVLEKQSHIEM